MSAFTTIAISRSAAKAAIIRHIEHCDDEALALFANQLLMERLYNTRIVEDNDPDADDALVEDY